jgi:glutamate-5-semialdehyde dehydrogenase
MDNLRNEVSDFLRRARPAARALARLTTEQKNAALLAMADQLGASAGAILRANESDCRPTFFANDRAAKAR